MHTNTHLSLHTCTRRGSSPWLCSRMLDSLKILATGETETMECFVGNVSGYVLPERIFLSEPYQSDQKSVVCVWRVRQANLAIVLPHLQQRAQKAAMLSCSSLFIYFMSFFSAYLLFPLLSSSVFSRPFAEGILWHLEGVSCSTFLCCFRGMSTSQAPAAQLQLDVDFTVVVEEAACCSVSLYWWFAFCVHCIILYVLTLLVLGFLWLVLVQSVFIFPALLTAGLSVLIFSLHSSLSHNLGLLFKPQTKTYI